MCCGCESRCYEAPPVAPDECTRGAIRANTDTNMNILAVDDDELQLAVLSATLVDQGLPAPTLANSATAAMRIIEDALTSFDLLLLDIRMPDTDGIDLCRQIRALPGYEEVPVIMVTALRDRSNIERALDAGANDYVTKPFDKIELAARIRTAAQLSDAKADATHQRRDIADLRQCILEASGSSPEHPATIMGVPNVVDYYVFRNILLELPFTSTFAAAAFAVKIRRYEQIFYESENGEVYEVLKRVAASLSVQLLGRDYVVTYAGSGVFVCCIPSAESTSIEDLSNGVRCDLEAQSSEQVQAQGQKISLDFGPLQRNGLFTLDRRIGLLARAVESVAKSTKYTRGVGSPESKPHNTIAAIRRIIGGANA